MHAQIQKVFFRGGPTFFLSFLVLLADGGGGGVQIQLKASHHRPASETPFKWRSAGVSMMAQLGILAW